MSNITLIYPWTEFDRYVKTHQLPYGVFSLSNYLHSKGHKVNVIDTRFLIKNKECLNKVKKQIKHTDMFGFSVLTGNVESALEMSDLIKELSPDKKIIWGGIHPSLFPKSTCKDKSIDFVCRGEGEELFDELLNDKPLNEIDGLVYKKKNKIIINKERKPIDVNKLPEFDWKIIDIKKYLHSTGFSHGIEKSIFIQASRGCPYRCTFCVNRILKCYNKWRSRNTDHIINEIKSITNKYKISWVKFIDENFFANKKKSLEICKRMIDEKFDLKWNANVRADFFDNKSLTDNDLKIAVKSGFREADMGAESGSNKILRKLKKDITREQLINSAQRCNKFNITPVYSFMIGIPGETDKDINRTVSVMNEISKNCSDAVFLGPHIYRPYPGGELYEEVRKLGFREPSNLRDWPKKIEESEKSALSVGDKTGYTTYSDMTWIKNPKLVKRVVTYAAYAVQNPLTLIKRKKYAKAGFALISKLRFKTNFWLLPYEQKLYFNIIKKLRSKKD